MSCLSKEKMKMMCDGELRKRAGGWRGAATPKEQTDDRRDRPPR